MLKYLNHYNPQLQKQIQVLIKEETLGKYLLSSYPHAHTFTTDKALYTYTTKLKNDFMKGASSLSKVLYDNKIKDIHSALGTHTFVSRVQGGKLKAKHEIRISHIFKRVPEAFLKMIVVHELAHLKEKSHNKAFYKLCQHIEPQYHQYEFDLKVYLTYKEIFGKLY